jgi:DNA-binding CsgD family transcriptional regulator
MLREAREAFVETGDPKGPVRDEILASWRRSVRLAVPPDAPDLRYSDDIEADGLLVTTAGPVLQGLRNLLDLSEFTAVVADESARVLWSSASRVQLGGRFGCVQVEPGLMCDELSLGTNAIGITSVRRQSSVVHGYEHFADRLTLMACAAAPISDPRTGRTVGIVNLSSLARDANPLLLPLAERLASDVDHLLIDALAGPDRPVVEQFHRVRRWVKRPAAVLTPRTILTNAAADDVIGDADRDELWAWASAATRARGPAELVLPGEPETCIRCQPLHGGDVLIGYLLLIDRTSRDGSDDLAGDARSTSLRTIGRARLTEREQEVAELVAHGFTNKQIAHRVMLSRHTVDYHIRQIFRKLAVNSRVELTRLVLARSARTSLQAAPGSSA